MIRAQPLPAPDSAPYRALVDRSTSSILVDGEAKAVLERVRQGRDRALRELTLRFDGVDMARSRVDPKELERAVRAAPAELIEALERAARHISRVHGAQRFLEEEVEVVPGVSVGRAWRPLARVGIYVPGGRGAYPSSVLMMAVPARLAGCREVLVCSPPGRDGRVDASVLAAAAIAGVTEVHAVGGAQAIGAMAFGTESIAKVDKIFGPGNPHVTAAKRLVFGEVGVDMPAGPSEVVVIADGSAPADWVGADLAAQAEHAPDATAVLVSLDADLADRVGSEIDQCRVDQIRVFTTELGSTAVEFANDFCPEHLILAVEEPERWLSKIFNAGSVFLGAATPAAAGDYATGANHVLPTGGSARRFSALGLEAFGHVMQIQRTSPAGLARVAPVIREIAAVEGFTNHWESVRLRIESSPALEPATPLPRASVRDMEPYQWEMPTAEVARRAGIEPEQVIRFDTNTSPWAGADLSRLGPLCLNEYPDATYAKLTLAVSAYASVDPETVTVGAGADELLDLVAKAFVGSSDPVLLSNPTYSMYRSLSEQVGAQVREVPCRGWELDRRAVLELAPAARVTWLCNPNNPSGELLPLDFLSQLARSTAGLVVVDEAYYEFTGTTAVGLIAEQPNLIVVRTLSKAFGLAGARVGYGVSSPAVGASLARVRPPGSVSSVAAALGVSALADQVGMRERVAELGLLQERLAADLTDLGLRVRRSPANFILVEAAPELVHDLAGHGLVLRSFSSNSAMAGWARVTVRAAEENDRLVEAVRQARLASAS